MRPDAEPIAKRRDPNNASPRCAAVFYARLVPVNHYRERVPFMYSRRA